MANKKRSASSSRWLQEHFSDKYVQQAKKKGFALELGLNWKKFSKVITFSNQV